MDGIRNFLDAIFYDKQDGEHVLCWRGTKPTPGFPISVQEFIDKAGRSKKPAACYFSTATVHMDADGKLFNRQGQFAAMYCLVLDDIGEGPGSKCGFDALPDLLREEYSYRVETSPDNFQYGYVLKDPIKDVHVAKEFVRLIYGAGEWDSGGAMPNKLVRLPCGVNLKKKYAVDGELFEVKENDDRCLADDWDGMPMWTCDELLESVSAGVTLEEIVAGHARCRDTKRGTTAWRQGVYQEHIGGVVDDVLEWLNEEEKIINETDTWIDIECPWAESHSEGGGNSAGYKPLGVGDNPERRGFHCFHDHCSSHGTSEFLSWVGNEGGPTCAVVDPIPALVAQWAIDEKNNVFVDMKAEVPDRVPNAGFKTSHSQYVHWLDHKDKPVKATQYALITQSPSLMKLRGSKYLPGAGRVIEEGGNKILNDWRVPNWPANVCEEKHVKRFTEFLEYLIPDYSELFIDHLAAKVQNPQYRGPCFILSTPAFGSGRGTLGKMIGQLWGGYNVSSVGLSELIAGMSGEGFNDWMQSSWWIVPEAREASMSRRQESRAYESLKNGVDPQPTSHIIKVKHGSQTNEIVYSSGIICTNHHDVFNIPVTDRRFIPLECTVRPADGKYFSGLHNWLHGGWEASVWNFLRERDLSNYDGFAAKKMLKKRDQYESVLAVLPGQSAVDRLVSLSCLYADKFLDGGLCTSVMCNAIENSQILLGVAGIRGWDSIFKRGLQVNTAEVKNANGRRRKLKKSNKNLYIRHTLDSRGYEFADKSLIDCPRFKDKMMEFDEKSYVNYMKTVLEEAGL